MYFLRSHPSILSLRRRGMNGSSNPSANRIVNKQKQNEVKVDVHTASCGARRSLALSPCNTLIGQQIRVWRWTEQNRFYRLHKMSLTHYKPLYTTPLYYYYVALHPEDPICLFLFYFLHVIAQYFVGIIFNMFNMFIYIYLLIIIIIIIH